MRWLHGSTIGLLCVVGCASFERVDLQPSRSAAEIRKRSLQDPDLRAFVEKVLGISEARLGQGWDLDSLTLVALYYQPSMDLFRARLASANHGISVARQLLNPTLTVTPGYTLNATKATSAWFPGLTLDFPVETAGKREIRTAMASHAVVAAHHGLLGQAWSVRGRVRNALVTCRVSQGRSAILGQIASEHEKCVETARKRFEKGLDSSLEYRTRSLAEARARQEYLEAKRVETAARGLLAVELALPADALHQQTLLFGEDTVLADVESLEVGEMLDVAMTERSDVKVALAEYEMSQESLRLQIAKQYPDIHLGTGYQYDQGDHKWSFGLGVELPVMNQNQAGIAEAIARRSEARARVLMVQTEIHSQVSRSLEEARGAISAYNASLRLRQIQQESFLRTEATFRAGGIDLLEMQSARLEAGSADLLVYESRARLIVASAQLEDAIQRPFKGLWTVENPPQSRTP